MSTVGSLKMAQLSFLQLLLCYICGTESSAHEDSGGTAEETIALSH